MRRGLKLLPLLLAAAVLSTSCGKLFRSGVQTYTDEPFPKLLSAWGLLEKGAPLKAAKGVIAYELNTPLFSDYALKYRYLWLPEGQAARYSENDVFDFPVGTVIAKTFAFPDDTGHEKLIETRVLVHAKAGWKAFANGKELPIAKVNYVLRGLALVPGKYNIEFRFEPEGYLKGSRYNSIANILYGLLLVLLLAMFVKSFIKPTTAGNGE